jgi:hypothetical protein
MESNIWEISYINYPSTPLKSLSKSTGNVSRKNALNLAKHLVPIIGDNTFTFKFGHKQMNHGSGK